MESKILRRDYGDYVHLIFKGFITVETLFSWIQKFLKTRISQNALWDFREADSSEITQEQFTKILSFLKDIDLELSKKNALLFSNQDQAELGKAFEAYSQEYTLPTEYQCFMDFETAVEWVSMV